MGAVNFRTGDGSQQPPSEAHPSQSIQNITIQVEDHNSLEYEVSGWKLMARKLIDSILDWRTEFERAKNEKER